MKKMNIKLIIMAIASVVIISLSILVFAAFSFNKNVVSDDVLVGDVVINNKSFVSYAKKTNEQYEDTQEYYRLCKLRTDSYAYVEGFTINSTFEEVNITSIEGDTYYYENTETNGYEIATSYESGKTYFARTDAITVKTAYDSTNTLLSVVINNNQITLKKNDTIIEVLTLTLTNNVKDNYITSVTLSGSSTRRSVVGSDGLSVYIFNKEIGTSVEIENDDVIECYASERKKNDSRIKYDVPYLNQLGMVFEFTTKIPVYVRIHIQDAWISTQFLSSKSERIRYVSKDTISGVSPFAVSDSRWYYDVDQNIAYYKTMFEPLQDEDGNYLSQKYTFNVNEGYFYHDTSALAAQKVTTVKVSFTVDIVQANRAEALWGVDFNELFNN